MAKLFVIIAIFPQNDADTISVAVSKEDAIKDWRKYMTENFGEPNGDELDWLNRNCDNLRHFGKTEREDSGVFYRLNPMIAR